MYEEWSRARNLTPHSVWKCHIELGMGKNRRWWKYCSTFVWPWNLLTVIADTVLIVNLSCCNVFNCCKMKNMRTVIILRYGVFDSRPDGDKPFRNSEDRSVRSARLPNIQRLNYGKSWNPLGLKYSRPGTVFALWMDRDSSVAIATC
jgi:hypothetical protein